MISGIRYSWFVDEILSFGQFVVVFSVRVSVYKSSTCLGRLSCLRVTHGGLAAPTWVGCGIVSPQNGLWASLLTKNLVVAD